MSVPNTKPKETTKPRIFKWGSDWMVICPTSWSNERCIEFFEKADKWVRERTRAYKPFIGTKTP